MESLIFKFKTTSAKLFKQIIANGQAVSITSEKKHCGVQIPLEKEVVLIPLKDKDNLSTVGCLYNTEIELSDIAKILIDELIMFCN